MHHKRRLGNLPQFNMIHLDIMRNNPFRHPEVARDQQTTRRVFAASSLRQRMRTREALQKGL